MRPFHSCRGRTAAALVALAVAPPLPGCDAAEGGTGTGVLLVALDGLRADHLGCLGHDRPTTPHLDRLAEQGALFTQAWSTAPDLIPAHVSLLTGCDPAIARLRIPRDLELPEKHRWSVPHRAPRLAMQFLAAPADGGGETFATAAFLDTADLPPFGRYDAGFQVFEYEELRHRRQPEERGAEALTGRLLQWLSGLPPDRSWFAYLHLRDMERVWVRRDETWDRYFAPRPGWDHVPPVSGSEHAFFAVPRSRWGGTGVTLGEYEARYDGAIRRVDEVLGALFGELELTGRWEHTTVSVVGTHGVQFGEAGRILTSGMLSAADLHVPWILRPAPSAGLAGWPAGGRRIDGLASLVDVAPTLLELAGLGVPGSMQGRSLVPALAGAEEPVREFAFASRFGPVTGTAAFGTRWTMERIAFDENDSAVLEQWFGTATPDAPLQRERVYDRRATPYPTSASPRPGDGESGDGAAPAEVVAQLAGAMRRWQAEVLAGWVALQDRRLPGSDAAGERP